MYDDWQEKLVEVFPDYLDSFTRSGEWDSLMRMLRVGDPVSGVVVTRAPFGAWIDLGVGFPALLEIPYVAGLTPERYQAGDWCRPGSHVNAVISAFGSRQIAIRQTATPNGALASHDAKE